MKTRYLPKALAQLDQICSLIEAENPAAAKAINDRIRQSIERLASFPFSCRETNWPGIRIMPIRRYPYLVFYTVDPIVGEVRILRIRHSARDPAGHLR